MADKAVLLGINNYKSVSDLRGCLNDVENMRKLLTGTFRFDPANIKTLRDAEVTKAKVTPLMRWLFKDARQGDRLVFHFSGHGSFTADQDGDESDALDELICLHDMDFHRPNTYFTDDELRDWLATLPKGPRLLVVMDNCHSGTGTRKIVSRGLDVPIEKVPLVQVRETAARAAVQGTRSAAGQPVEAVLDPGSPEAVLARFVEPPSEILERAERAARRGSRGGPGLEAVKGLNHVLLAACRDNQTAADAHIGGTFNGAFTYHLCKVFGEAGPDLDRGDLARRIAKALADERFEQVPQLEAATLEGSLFGGDGGGSGARPGGSTTPDGPSGTPETPAEGPIGVPAEGAGSDLPRRMEEFLAAYNRVLEAGGVVGTALAPGRIVPGRAVGGRHIVFVHGICRHDRGFSDGWWASLRPFAAGLHPGQLGGNRHEVLWSHIVRPDERAPEVPSPREEEVRERIIETLDDRAQRQAIDAAPQGPEVAGRALDADGSRALLRIPGLDCIGDFTKYLLDPSIRERVIAAFHDVVRPLLEGGARVDIIGHSWGTVIAYEGLRFLDGVSRCPAGSVLNFFTVGSALSIGEIKRLLAPATLDGRKPRVVRRWVNLDARFDVVGGPLQGRPFEVDQEFLNLEPTGCSPAFIPQPVCAHGSYFVKENTAVNRDIFGRFLRD